MAEVLGLFASGIAVTQLADGIVRSIRNIRDFWQSVRDAPKDLNDALEELEILGATLMELQNDLRNHGGRGLSGTAASECLQYCRKAAGDLEAIVMGLKQGLDLKSGRRHWAAIKASFQKRALQDFQQRLDRAKSMLTLAISSYSLYALSPLARPRGIIELNQS
jgi:Fungal N-terminal domain of STAND proteins